MLSPRLIMFRRRERKRSFVGPGESSVITKVNSVQKKRKKEEFCGAWRVECYHQG